MTTKDYLKHLSYEVCSLIQSGRYDLDEVQALINEVIEDVLTSFEAQVKIQQWKHAQQLPL